MGSSTPRLSLYKPAPGDAASTYDTEFPANMDILDNAVLVTTIDAAGDLLIGTANDAVGRLAIGTNTQVLTSNGTTATWQTPGASTHPGYAAHARWTND